MIDFILGVASSLLAELIVKLFESRKRRASYADIQRLVTATLEGSRPTLGESDFRRLVEAVLAEIAVLSGRHPGLEVTPEGIGRRRRGIGAVVRGTRAADVHSDLQELDRIVGERREEVTSSVIEPPEAPEDPDRHLIPPLVVGRVAAIDHPTPVPRLFDELDARIARRRSGEVLDE